MMLRVGLRLLTGIRLPGAVEQPVSALSAAATPTALLILGGTLHFDSISRNRKYIAAVTLIKLICVPALILVCSYFLGFNPVERFVVFAVFATPVATASFPMAAAMGGDASLAGELVVISTVISVFTLFLWIFGMSSFGWI